MFDRLGVFLGLLGLFRRKEANPAAEAMLAETSEKGIEHFDMQLMRAATDARLVDAEPGEISGILENDKLLGIELPFMWGWNHAFADQAGDWPTTSSQRATLQMMRYMMDRHRFDFPRARAEAKVLDDLWNEKDPLFDAIQQQGFESFYRPNDPLLADVIIRITNFNSE